MTESKAKDLDIMKHPFFWRSTDSRVPCPAHVSDGNVLCRPPLARARRLDSAAHP